MNVNYYKTHLKHQTGKIDITTYGNVEYPSALCHTNDAVNAINKYWNEHNAKTHKITKHVKGFDNTNYILYKGLVLMAYKTHTSYTFTNSQELIVISWTNDTFLLQDTTNKMIELDIKYTTSF